MRFLNAHKNSKGFTVIEILIVAFIVAIISAIAIPSFTNIIDKVTLNNGVTEVRGALREAQREAISKSVPCTVTLKIAARQLTGFCLSTGDRTLPDSVAMATNISQNTSISGNPIQIIFGILGTAEFTVISSVTPPALPTDPSGKIVLYLSNNPTSQKQCVAISNTLGLTRAGTYKGSINAADITDSGSCTAS